MSFERPMNVQQRLSCVFIVTFRQIPHILVFPFLILNNSDSFSSTVLWFCSNSLSHFHDLILVRFFILSNAFFMATVSLENNPNLTNFYIIVQLSPNQFFNHQTYQGYIQFFLFQNHWFTYNEPIPPESLTQSLSNLALAFGNRDYNKGAMVNIFKKNIFWEIFSNESCRFV